MTDKRIVIWGAGRIGRGYVADLFNAGGYHITFVGRSPERMERLRAAGQYRIARLRTGEERTEALIDGYEALATAQAAETARAIADANLVAVAVFSTELPTVASQLAPGLLLRRRERPDVPLDILMCINPNDRAAEFRRLLHENVSGTPGAGEYVDRRVGVVDAMAMRGVVDPPEAERARDPLLMWTDGGRELAVDRRAFKGPYPQVPGLRLVEDMRAEGTRKLFMYNMAHAVIGYFGYRAGYVRSADAIRDPQIRRLIEGALDESGRALQAEFGFPDAEMRSIVEDVWRRYGNPALQDAVVRLSADPPRKLQRGERLIGPALLALKHGIVPAHLARLIAAALRHGPPDDPGARRVRALIEERGVEAAMRDICGLTDEDQRLIDLAAKAWRELGD